MGIYIKGMEMPTSCAGCELAKHFDGYSENDCPFNSFSYYDCPLIPVPPHGRLIDADALLADVRKNSESYFADDFAHEWVDKQPTIIEAEGET